MGVGGDEEEVCLDYGIQSGKKGERISVMSAPRCPFPRAVPESESEVDWW